MAVMNVEHVAAIDECMSSTETGMLISDAS